VIVDY